MSDVAASASGQAPVLQVVRGSASPEELAAVVAVLLSRGGAPAEQPAPPPSRWSWRADQLRRPLLQGPGAWRASGLPR